MYYKNLIIKVDSVTIVKESFVSVSDYLKLLDAVNLLYKDKEIKIEIGEIVKDYKTLREVLKEKLNVSKVQSIHLDCLNVILDCKESNDLCKTLNRIDLGAGVKDDPSKMYFALQALINLLDKPV